MRKNNRFSTISVFRNMIYGLPLKGEVKPRVMEYVIAAMISESNVARNAITGSFTRHSDTLYC